MTPTYNIDLTKMAFRSPDTSYYTPIIYQNCANLRGL